MRFMNIRKWPIISVIFTAKFKIFQILCFEINKKGTDKYSSPTVGGKVFQQPVVSRDFPRGILPGRRLVMVYSETGDLVDDVVPVRILYSCIGLYIYLYIHIRQKKFPVI